MNDELSHVDPKEGAVMVSVSKKAATYRTAVAKGVITMRPETLDIIKNRGSAKGDVLTVAKIAGIAAAKKTSELIPLCHSIPIEACDISFEFIEGRGIEVSVKVAAEAKTGVEMEAISAVSIALATVYDMAKAVDRGMTIGEIRLIEKRGGKSDFFAERVKPLGRVIAVNISQKKGTVKTPVPFGNFIEDHGLEGDAHAGKGIRQVSLLGRESYAKYKDREIKGLCDGKFAENITTEGIILYELPIGTRLKIGETLQEVTQIGKACHDGCEIQRLVGSCVMPKEGIFSKVLRGGAVRPGDLIEIL